MNLPISVDQEGLMNVLLNIAPVRPVFIWGAPGIGKSALVEKIVHLFALKREKGTGNGSKEI